MSIERLPTEILIQVLDDASLEIGDLAVISRVSRLWHSAVVPVLYRRFTFRYYPSLKPEEQKRLESFSKYGHHVRQLSLHIKDWIDEDDPRFRDPDLVPDITTYLHMLDPFTEVTHIEHYDIDIRGMTWPNFWAILHYIVSKKQDLISLTVRRNPHWNVNPPRNEDIDIDTLLRAPLLVNLTSFNFQVNGKHSRAEGIESFPSLVGNFVLVLGDSCRNVSKLQLYLKMVDKTGSQTLANLLETDFRLLPLDNVKELTYVVSPDITPPSRLFRSEFEETKILTTTGWVCGHWLPSAWEKVPLGESFNYFKNVETLRITDIFKTDEGNNLERNIEFVAKYLPNLGSLILEDDERQFSISRKLDGSLVWEEVAFVV
ncbi:hypothetical protein TWF506_006082 [Arthrobotrys conoides]|uniref:F-box domain-containing protein n=1 Tax=Arthrobotrys conoides TaxID=74498 RepID=A0AAN8NR28_9PEZI